MATSQGECALGFSGKDQYVSIGSVEALGRRRRSIVGSPSTVRAGIEALAAEYGADEVMIVTITYDHAARRRSYELIAKALRMSRDTAARTGD